MRRPTITRVWGEFRKATGFQGHLVESRGVERSGATSTRYTWGRAGSATGRGALWMARCLSAPIWTAHSEGLILKAAAPVRATKRSSASLQELAFCLPEGPDGD